MKLKRTPLYPVYAEHGGRTIDFGGWELPVQFSGILREHEQVRGAAGLFDVSHMGELIVSGAGAAQFLQYVTTNDVTELKIGQAQYSLMCNPDGGVVDDLLVYRLAADVYMLVINAGNTEKDVEWLKHHLVDDVELDDISDRTALLAVQGPHAAAIVGQVTTAPVAQLASFHFMRDAEIASGVADTIGSNVNEKLVRVDESAADTVIRGLISRTGYTGEDGFELYIPAEHAVTVWRALLDAGRAYGLAPAGLGARDTLRFEARLPLYGQELSPDISPLEAGLGLFVKLDKGDFIGREALRLQKEAGVRRKLVGIEMIDRGIARSQYPIFDAAGVAIGQVTSGTQSPTLRKNVGLALVDVAYSSPGTEIWVDIRGKRLRAVVVKTPFYRRQAAGG